MSSVEYLTSADDLLRHRPFTHTVEVRVLGAANRKFHSTE